MIRLPKYDKKRNLALEDNPESTIYIDEIGVEPLGYIGVIQVIYDGEVRKADHLLRSTSPYLTQIVSAVIPGRAGHRIGSGDPFFKHALVLPRADHRMTATLVKTLPIVIPVISGKHLLPVYNKYNAPVDYTCDRYLETPCEDKILETPVPFC